MTHEDAFMQAILENPEDDLPRLVYADWLTDQGDPRGEFVHAQCQLAGMDEHDPRRSRLEARVREMLDRHQDAWLGPLRPLLSQWTFRRGFLDEVAVRAAVHLALAPLAWPATVRHVEVDLQEFEAPAEVIEFVPASVAYHYALLPLGFRGQTVVLAMKDPKHAATRETMEFILNRSIEPVAAPAGQIAESVARYYYGQAETDSVENVLVDYAGRAAGAEADRLAASRLVDLFFFEAVILHADQIRLVPWHDGVRVTYRIGRCWAEGNTLPRRLLEAVVARIRQESGLGAADAGGSQAGRMQRTARGRVPDLDVEVWQDGDGFRVSLALAPLGRGGPQAT